MTDTPPTQSRTAARGGTSTASRGSTATASRPAGSSNGSAAPTSVQAALHAVDQLKYTVNQLEQELHGYNDTNVVGRDTILLRSYFDQGVGRFMQIAQALKINWTPPTAAPRGR